jgi:predicted DNA-binding protein
MPFSLRLDQDTEARIRRLSARTGRSKAQVVREAVAQYEPENATLRPGESTFDRLKAYVGVVRTGGANYSTSTHAKYRALLRRKQHARRAR